MKILIFLLVFHVQTSVNPNHVEEARCFARKNKRSCYRMEACFWHSRGNSCEYVDSWERSEGCQIVSDIVECYAVPTCFWHSKRGTCESLAKWTDSCPVGTIQIPLPTSGRPIHSSGRQPIQPALNTRGCGDFIDKQSCFALSTCFWDFKTTICVHLDTGAPPQTDPREATGLHAPGEFAPVDPTQVEPTQCNDIYLSSECGRAVFDGHPCLWEAHDESCVPFECENRQMAECNSVAFCFWDSSEQKCLEHQFLYYSLRSTHQTSQIPPKRREFLLLIFIIPFLVFEFIRRRWRKSEIADENLLIADPAEPL